MTARPKTPLLDTVNTPGDLRKLPADKLRQLADELRDEMIDAVGSTGGHLGSGLGVVELTVALHYVFNTPDDRLIWDVGHQAYPHKILTGRRDRIRTLRQGGGNRFPQSMYEHFHFGRHHHADAMTCRLCRLSAPPPPSPTAPKPPNVTSISRRPRPVYPHESQRLFLTFVNGPI